jgi:hypothetical protein
MATEKQIAANRQNAQKSTGPKTPEGRAAMRFNALRHGLDAASALIPGESTRAFHQLRQAFFDQYNPGTASEVSLVAQLITSTWELFRVQRWESGFFELTENSDHRECQRILQQKSVPERIVSACAIRTDTQYGNIFEKLARTRSRAERSFHRALHELERIHARRAGKDVPVPQVLDVIVDGDGNFFSEQSQFSSTRPGNLNPTPKTTYPPVPPAEPVVEQSQ